MSTAAKVKKTKAVAAKKIPAKVAAKPLPDDSDDTSDDDLPPPPQVAVISSGNFSPPPPLLYLYPNQLFSPNIVFPIYFVIFLGNV